MDGLGVALLVVPWVFSSLVLLAVVVRQRRHGALWERELRNNWGRAAQRARELEELLKLVTGALRPDQYDGHRRLVERVERALRRRS